jgi:outer membrane protein OmpA-like peptidoglycan-associated protein
MSKHLACLMTVIAALSTASPAVAADSQTVALPPDPDRVLLKPGECGSAVTGKDRLRWFCAEASAMSSAQEDGTIEDAGEGAASQRRLLEQQAQMERQLNAALEQLRAAHNANEATQRESEAQLAEAQQTLAGLHHKVEAFQVRAAEQDSEAVAARQTIAGLQEEIDTLKASAAEQDSEAVAAQQTIAGLQEEIDTLKARAAEQDSEAVAARQTIAGLQEEIDTLKARAAEQDSEAVTAQQTIAGLRQEIETLEVEQAQTKAGAAEAQQIISGLREEFDALNARLKTSEDRAESYRALLGDSDHDGVADPGDLCSGTGAGRTVDRTGCAIGEEIVLEGVAFAWNSSELTPESRRLLDGLATRLNNHPDLYFEVAGHTDSTGSAEANRMLSTRRAEAVRDYLLTKGVSADRLVAVGYGEQRPIADNNDQTGRALNRRVSLSWLE